IVNKDAQDFFSRVQESMKKIPPPSPNETAAEEPAAPAETGAKIEIISKPEGADIELDGNFAGNTPSTVGVKPGEHTVKVTRKGYKPWERKITTTSGTIKLSPELEAIEVTQESKPQ
ncbi:MAG TPA: PEGA domain-containing protein, partial [Terriglobia bacterium]|nr:PEGA domain-containing protein [Terriglobia bacterium]